jgi:hypothetical protein
MTDETKITTIPPHTETEFTLKTGHFTVLTWNANFDHRALTGPFSWAARRAGVISMICHAGADFVCLQELREDAVRDLAASPLIGAVYDMTYGRTNATGMSFYLVTLWMKCRWSCSTSRSLWFGEREDMVHTHWVPCSTGNGFGRFALEATFYRAAFPDPKAGKVIRHLPDVAEQPLVIYNAHFGLSQPERMLEANALHRHARAATAGAHALICGDFNTFPDTGGLEEVAILEHGCVLPAGTLPVPEPLFADIVPYGGKIRTATGLEVVGTQISYPQGHRPRGGAPRRRRDGRQARPHIPLWRPRARRQRPAHVPLRRDPGHARRPWLPQVRRGAQDAVGPPALARLVHLPQLKTHTRTVTRRGLGKGKRSAFSHTFNLSCTWPRAL